MSQRIFVTGTGTDVGKTLVAGIIAHAWRAHYWKPIQAGTHPTTDSRTVAGWIDPAKVLPEGRVLQLPASPNQAATAEDTQLSLSEFTLPDVAGSLVVEGAGGLMVPLNDQYMIIDLIAALKLPVVLTAATGLGTLNHTLLSIEALRRRSIPIAGIVLNGPEHPANQRDIQHFGQAPIWGRIPVLETVDASQFDRLYATWKVNL